MSQPGQEFTSIEEIEALIRSRRPASVPTAVASLLEDRLYSFAEPKRFAELLAPMMERLRAELREYGRLQPDHPPALSTPPGRRERTLLRSLLILNTNYAYATGKIGEDMEQAVVLLDEAGYCARLCDLKEYEVTILNTKGVILYEAGDKKRELETYEEALAVAREVGSPDVIAQSLRQLADALQSRGDYERGLTYAAEALELLEGNRGEPNEIAIALLTKGRILREMGRTTEGLPILLKAIETLGDNPLPLILINLLTILTYTYADLGDITEALKLALRGARVASENNLPVNEGLAYVHLSALYLKLDDVESAQRAFERAAALAEEVDSAGLRLRVRTEQGKFLLRKGKFDEARECFLEALEISRRMNDAGNICSLYTRLAACDEEKGERNSALEWYRKGLEIAEGSGQFAQISLILLKIGLMYEQGGDDSEAMRLYRRSIDALGDRTPDTTTAEAYQRIAGIYKRRGEHAAALEEYERFHAIAVADKEELAKRELNNLRALHEVEQAQYEAEIERLRRERAEAQLAAEKARLVGAGVALTDKGELIHAMERRIKSVMAKLDEKEIELVGETLREVLQEINAHTAMNGAALRYLRSTDEEFYAQLRERWPDLTTGQLRLCSLIRAGLDPGEAASVLHISVEGMKTQRRRLRKKLGLNQGEKLETFLAAVGAGER